MSQNTVVEKNVFEHPSNFTQSQILWKYLQKNLCCVSDAVAASDGHKHAVFFFLFFFWFMVNEKKTTKLNY